MSGRTVLVTGASGGLGRELARLFAADGFDVALVGRTGAVLEDLAQEIETRYRVTAPVLPFDLARAAGPRELVTELGFRGVRVDSLVNGAGLDQSGAFAEVDERRMLELLQVNLAALAHLTRLVLPGMIQRGWGRIVNISSSDALRLGSQVALRRASEAFVLSFSLALADELRSTGVRVTALCPPATRQLSLAAHAPSAVAEPGLEDAELAEVAAWGYLAVRRGRPLAVRGARRQALAMGTRLLPATAASRIARRVQGRLPG